ncbi:MAG: hypothetical protein E7603_07130 [Ruminococcaceae bacterium]|nr:hypothetical protein [Oscillospiraceae bacterium]
MNANTKKIILFLVEGSTDSTSLGLVMSRLLENADVRFYILGGDICYRYHITNENAERSVLRFVNGFLQRYRLKKSDLLQIVHIIDTDGAFIPPERVIFGGKEHATYKETSIETLSVDSLRSRNEMKTKAASALSKLSHVEKIPYALYYFSRNIEHVLHNRADSLSGREKRIFSENFENTYADHPEDFIRFMQSREVAVRGSYSKTWEYILRGTNSLKRGSNFGLYFNWQPKTEET